MSNFIQVQQPLGRVDPNALRGDVDLDTDLRGQGYQDLSALPAHDEPAAADAALHALDASERLTPHRFHGASHELVVIEPPRLERLQLLLGHPQLLPRKPLHVVDPRAPFEPDDRPPALRAWRTEVEATRVKGYAVDEGNYIKGVTVIAAPVGSGSERVSHVVVAAGLTEQVRDIGVDRLARELSATASELSKKLGGQ